MNNTDRGMAEALLKAADIKNPTEQQKENLAANLHAMAKAFKEYTSPKLQTQSITKIVQQLAEQQDNYLREVFNLKPTETPEGHTFRCPLCGETKPASEAILQVTLPTTTPPPTEYKETNVKITEHMRVVCQTCDNKQREMPDLSLIEKQQLKKEKRN